MQKFYFINIFYLKKTFKKHQQQGCEIKQLKRAMSDSHKCQSKNQNKVYHGNFQSTNKALNLSKLVEHQLGSTRSKVKVTTSNSILFFNHFFLILIYPLFILSSTFYSSSSFTKEPVPFIQTANANLNSSLSSPQTTLDYDANSETTELFFYKLLKEETDKALGLIQNELSQEDRHGLEKGKEIILNVLKHFNVWNKSKHLIRQHGKGITIICVVTEVITTFVVPSLLLGTDFQIISAISAGTPSATYIIPSYIAIKNFFHRRKLADQIGFTPNQITELNKFRNELIGFSIENKIMDTIIDELNQSEPVTILRNGFFKKSKNLQGRVITLNELESIVKEHFGNQKIKMFKKFSIDNTFLYTNLLLQEINHNNLAQTAFLNIVHNRVQQSHLLLEDPSIRNLISTVHAYQNEIQALRSTLNEVVPNIENNVSSINFDNNLSSLQSVSQIVNEKLNELNQMDLELKIFEYNFLNSLKSKTFLSGEQLFLHEFRLSIISIKNELHSRLGTMIFNSSDSSLISSENDKTTLIKDSESNYLNDSDDSLIFFHPACRFIFNSTL